jgi:hypothetical protein
VNPAPVHRESNPAASTTACGLGGRLHVYESVYESLYDSVNESLYDSVYESLYDSVHDLLLKDLMV